MTTSQEHFSAPARPPAAPGRFVDVSAIGAIELVPGLEFRPVLGESTLVNFVSFAPFTEAPGHAHEEEQIVVVLEGEMDFSLDGEVRTVRRGDVVAVPPFVVHGARTNDTSCLEIDIFTPPRASLLEHARRERQRRESGPGAGTDPGNVA
ncbi:MAG: cupin domain-containing protein [Acidimicrobiales bacterium]